MSQNKSKNKSKNTHENTAAFREDSGYPFDTGDWEKWSNRERLDWMINLRDKLRDTYKQKFNISDDRIAELSAGVEEYEKVVFHEEYTAAQTAVRNALSPRESARLLGELIFDLCDKDYYKARRLGFTDGQIDEMRAQADKYLAEIEAWERRQHANDILGIPRANRPPTDDGVDSLTAQPRTTFDDIDDTAFKTALAAGDEDTAHREFNTLIEKLEAKADADPVFAKWFEDFRSDQEKLLRWDDTIGEGDL